MIPADLPYLEAFRCWRDARHAAIADGWKLIGTGDWAWVYASPDDELAWRITPFDPASDYFTDVCLEQAGPHLPVILSRRQHPRGGSSVVMERLDDVAEEIAEAWTASFVSGPDASTSEMLRRLEAAAERCTIPLFMGYDTNPGNVRRRRPTGELVLIDAFWVDGPRLFELVSTDAAEAVRLFSAEALLEWAHIPALDEAATAHLLSAIAAAG